MEERTAFLLLYNSFKEATGNGSIFTFPLHVFSGIHVYSESSSKQNCRPVFGLDLCGLP
jgi:hypothetical protein